MRWFEHRHWWREKANIDLYEPGGGRPRGWMTSEYCSCGAVRTIEFFQGQAPVVRMASAPPEEKAAGIDKPSAETE